jgi:hypothetical protein
LLAAGALLACSPRPPAGVAPVPATPEATVGQFIAAVNANDLRGMEALFGDERGPFATYRPNATEREERMAIIQRLVACDSSRVLGWEPVPGFPRRRLLQVDVKKGDRWLAAPFTVVERRSGGWLVAVVKLDALLPGAGPRPNP